MASLTIKEALLSYETPLVVLAEDAKNRPYLGVNFGDDEQGNGYQFYFARVRLDTVNDLRDGGFDVHYVVTRKNLGKYELGTSWANDGDLINTRSQTQLDQALLPKPGMFLPVHRPSTVSTSAATATERRIVAIDGRWGINDLRKFSDSVQDCYALVFALSGTGQASVRQKIEALFHRYPWRGGYSSVNFFDDLYRLIPRTQKASIQRIQYASPGEIELNMSPNVANAIRKLVDAINEAESDAAETYEVVHSWLRDKAWLGRSSEDIHLTVRDKEELMEKLSTLAKSFCLASSENHVLGFAKHDPLGAVKILLAYYRRVANLADYVATGKAQDLFHTVQS